MARNLFTHLNKFSPKDEKGLNVSRWEEVDGSASAVANKKQSFLGNSDWDLVLGKQISG